MVLPDSTVFGETLRSGTIAQVAPVFGFDAHVPLEQRYEAVPIYGGMLSFIALLVL